MTLNSINLLIGLAVGFALGMWLRTSTPTDRDDNVHVMRRPLGRAG